MNSKVVKCGCGKQSNTWQITIICTVQIVQIIVICHVFDGYWTTRGLPNLGLVNSRTSRTLDNSRMPLPLVVVISITVQWI